MLPLFAASGGLLVVVVSGWEVGLCCSAGVLSTELLLSPMLLLLVLSAGVGADSCDAWSSVLGWAAGASGVLTGSGVLGISGVLSGSVGAGAGTSAAAGAGTSGVAAAQQDGVRQQKVKRLLTGKMACCAAVLLCTSKLTYRH